jgi:hypothetical protein
VIDQSDIDLVELISQHTTLRQQSRGDWRGPCPLHDGRNRTTLRVRQLPDGIWRWRCYRGCGGGDAIAFIQQRHNVDFGTALQLLGINTNAVGQGRPRRRRAPQPPPPTNPPPDAWQAAVSAFVADAQARLWSPAGQAARSELAARRLTEATIKQAGLGFNPTDRFAAKDTYGLPTRDYDIWLPWGTVIPWFVDGAIWKVSIRRPDGIWCVADPDVPPPVEHPHRAVWHVLRRHWRGLTTAEIARLLGRSESDIAQTLPVLAETGHIVPAHKYHHLPGGSNALYSADRLQSGRPVILCEGMLDALAVQQEAGDLAAAVASGTSGAQTALWIIRLSLARPLLISFDNDEAGVRATAYWQDAIRTAWVWRAYHDDPATMLQDGWDVRAWVERGLAYAEGRTQTAVRGQEASAPPTGSHDESYAA